MSGLWTPPGADLGEFDGPGPDPRMKHFIGGLDSDGQPLPMTYRRGREVADGWVITSTTPEGPASLLKTAKDMFALGFYAYELIASANAWAFSGVEAALKHRLARGKEVQMARLLKEAEQAGLIDEALADKLDAGRRLRNNFVHEGRQGTWTLGMAAGVIGTSFEVVAHLFPEPEAAATLTNQ